MASFYRLEVATQVLAAAALIGVLKLGLLASLLAGLLVYQLVHILTPSGDSALVPHRAGKIIVVALLAVIVIVASAGAILGLVSLLSSGAESLPVLLRKMAEVVETARSTCQPGLRAGFQQTQTSSRKRPQHGCGTMQASCAPMVEMSG